LKTKFNFFNPCFYLLLLGVPFLVTLTPTKALAQTNIDSLQLLLEHSQDTTRVRLLNQLAFALRGRDTEKAYNYAQEAVDYSRQIKFPAGEALALNRLAIANGFKSEFDQALNLLLESNQLAVKLQLWNLMGDNFLNLGGVYSSRSSTKKAFENYVQAYNSYEKGSNKNGMASALYGIGITYATEKKYELALANYNQSIQLFEELNQVREIPKVLVNVGLLYKDKKEYEEAIQNFSRAIQLFAETKNQRGRATAFLHRAETHFQQQQLSLAKIDLDSSMALNNKTNHEFNKVKCNLLFGKIYLEQGDLKKASSHLEEALVISQKIKLLDETSSIYETLALVSQVLGDYKKAYEFRQLYGVYHDSLFNKEKSRQLQELQVAYETEKKEAEIRELKSQQQLNQTYLYGSLALVGLVVLVAFLILNRQRLKIKKDKELADKENQIFEERRALVDAELQNRQLNEERLHQEIEFKNKELTTYTLNLIQKNEVLEKVKSAVEEIRNSDEREVKQKLSGLINTVNYSFNLDKDWENFRLHFEQVHQSFFDTLRQLFPDLNANDMKLCALIRLNMDTKEAASILDISPESAKVARHRLRKKLNLPSEQNLTAYLASI
jgi:tetratricopeptide (TPR) repeat protein/DNA-binding CsgD family transcriptional regulator